MKNSNFEDAVLKLGLLTETFIALEEAVEYTQSELPKHYLFVPVSELKAVSDRLNQILLND